jgi:biopolymer transport protein ExbD
MRLPLVVLLLVLASGVRLSPPPVSPAAKPARSPAPPAALVDERQIILEYSAAGVITVNGETIRRDALSSALRRIYADRRDRTLWLDGAGALRYGDVAEVIEIAKRAGVERVGVMTPEMRRRRTPERPGAAGKLRNP